MLPVSLCHHFANSIGPRPNYFCSLPSTFVLLFFKEEVKEDAEEEAKSPCLAIAPAAAAATAASKLSDKEKKVEENKKKRAMSAHEMWERESNYTKILKLCMLVRDKGSFLLRWVLPSSAVGLERGTYGVYQVVGTLILW